MRARARPLEAGPRRSPGAAKLSHRRKLTEGAAAGAGGDLLTLSTFAHETKITMTGTLHYGLRAL